MQKNISALKHPKQNASIYPVLVKINQIYTHIAQVQKPVSILDMKNATYNTKISNSPHKIETCPSPKNKKTTKSRQIEHELNTK